MSENITNAKQNRGSEKLIDFAALCVWLITSVLIWEHPISDGYWMVIGMCLLVIWSMKVTKDYTAA